MLEKLLLVFKIPELRQKIILTLVLIGSATALVESLQMGVGVRGFPREQLSVPGAVMSPFV